MIKPQMPRAKVHETSLRELKRILMVAIAKRLDHHFLHEISGNQPAGKFIKLILLLIIKYI